MTERMLGSEGEEMVQDHPCIRVLQRNKASSVCVCVCVCVCMGTKGGSFKESAPEAVGTGKSEACRGVWESGSSHTS